MRLLYANTDKSQKDRQSRVMKYPSYGCFVQYFLGLVITAPAKHPIPSRTRPLSAVALMVLRLKAWESKSSPNLVNTDQMLS